MKAKVTEAQLKETVELLKQGGFPVNATAIKESLHQRFAINIDASTIRGRFISMGIPLGGKVQQPTYKVPTPAPQAPPVVKPKVNAKVVLVPTHTTPDELKPYIPDEQQVGAYVKRNIDDKLAMILDLQAMGLPNKYPIAQGKQGTGKTLSYIKYAYDKQLPFFLWSAYEDFNLRKLYGDRTIVNGTVKFQEGVFVKAIQHASVILIDEVNAISQANIKDFNALLQNRELYIKDANDSKGKLYKLHPQCRIGFAQNPKSAKYIGGNIRSSDFLGRCMYITYPEFNKSQLKEALSQQYGNHVDSSSIDKFIAYYNGCVQAISANEIPVDISIRQLFNVMDMYVHGASLGDAIEMGTLNIMDSISQPKSKEAFLRVSEMVWESLKGGV